MEYRVFQYGVDDCYIKAILEEVAIACHGVVRTEEEFVQRFEQNPLGKTVLVCAFDGERMVSCVAVERLPIQCEGKILVGGSMRVLFVQDGYGTQDMWTGLLKVLEGECGCQGIDIVSCSKEQDFIASAKGQEWICREGIVRYRLNSVTGLWRNIFKMLDMKKPFVAEVKAEGVQNENMDDACIPDYFKWLIHTSTKRFVVVDNEEVCAVMVIGHRGKRVGEAQICYFEPKKSLGAAQLSLVEFVKGHFTRKEIDVVSCVDGKNYLSKKNSFSTSQELNYCYKWLGEPINVKIEEINVENYCIGICG